MRTRLAGQERIDFPGAASLMSAGSGDMSGSGFGPSKVVSSRSRIATVGVPSAPHRSVAAGFAVSHGTSNEPRPGAETETTPSGDRMVSGSGTVAASRPRALVQADRKSRPARIAASHSTCTGSEPAVTWDGARWERPVLPLPRSLPARELKDRLPCGISPPPSLSRGYRCALPARQLPPTACQFVTAHRQRFESSAAAVDERLDRRFVRDPLPLELLFARGGLATI